MSSRTVEVNGTSKLRLTNYVIGNKADDAIQVANSTASLVAYAKGALAVAAPVVTTGEMDIDISEAVYTGYITALTIVPAAGAPLADCVIDLDLNKTTTGAHAVGTAADTLDITVVSKIDGTNLRGIVSASQITISDTPTAADNGVRLNVGPVGVSETIQVQVAVSAERDDVEIPYAVYYRAAAAPTITAVEAV